MYLKKKKRKSDNQVCIDLNKIRNYFHERRSDSSEFIKRYVTRSTKYLQLIKL